MPFVMLGFAEASAPVMRVLCRLLDQSEAVSLLRAALPTGCPWQTARGQTGANRQAFGEAIGYPIRVVMMNDPYFTFTEALR
jgi:hypothetical protein